MVTKPTRSSLTTCDSPWVTSCLIRSAILRLRAWSAMSPPDVGCGVTHRGWEPTHLTEAITLGGMTWGARVGRAAVLSALGVGWAVAGHVWGGPAPHPGPSGPGLVLAPALWSLLAVLLLTSYLPDPDRTSSVRGAPGARLQAGAWVGAALGGGQLLTHVALSVAPLLQGQV